MAINEKELGFRHYVLIGLAAIIVLILVGFFLYLVFAGPDWIRVPFWILVLAGLIILILAFIGYWIVQLWNSR